MSRDEAKKIIAIMIAAFPNYHPQDLGAVVALWATMFANDTYAAVETALKAYIASDTSGFACTVGQIKALMAQAATRGELNESEAWALVRKAIGKSSYGAEEEYAKLPASIQRAVGSPYALRQWAQDEDFNEGVESSNFKRAYRNALEQQRVEIAMGVDLVKALGQHGVNLIEEVGA